MVVFVQPTALILRSRAAASRRIVEFAPETSGASFETRAYGSLLWMRA
jgi:hypothetical protein